MSNSQFLIVRQQTSHTHVSHAVDVVQEWPSSTEHSITCNDDHVTDIEAMVHNSPLDRTGNANKHVA